MSHAIIDEYDQQTGDGKYLANSLAILSESIQMSKPTVWNDVETEAPSEQCPEPGIYPGISFTEYCEWDAINHSRLCRIDKSPLHCKTQPDFEKSAAIRLGQLVHCGRLEPDSVEQRYAIMPEFELYSENTTSNGKPSTSTATTFVKQARLEFRQAAVKEQKTVVSTAEYTACQNALEAILLNRDVVAMVNTGRCELSIVWNDRHTGLRCKARLDCQRPNSLMDLKTSEDGRNSPLPESFEYAMWTYNYYTQAAFYQQGWETLTGERLPFWFAVVSTTTPMQCIAAPVGEMTLQLGRTKNAERMSKYLLCKQTDSWPGYESPEIFELPERYFPDEVKGR